jgi:hypothetical protein
MVLRSTNCSLCGWPLDDEHIFNVNCALANAENDQLEAEIDEARQQPLDAESQRLLEHGLEVMRDVIAQKTFEQMLRGPLCNPKDG